MKSGNRPSRSSCAFCRIARGDVRVHEVVRTDRIVAFMDIGPIREGHVQIIPCDHYDTFELIPPDLSSEIMHLGQKLAKAQKKLFGVDRVGFMFTGGDIAHAHAHLVPLVEKADITSRRYIVESKLTFRELPKPDDDLLRDTAAALAAKLG